MSVALPHCAVAQSAVYDCGIPDHTHLLFACVLVSLFLAIINWYVILTSPAQTNSHYQWLLAQTL